MLVIEIYYFAVYFSGESFINKANKLAGEMNLTASVEPYFWLALNIQRELMANPSKPIQHQNSFLMSMQMIQAVQDLNSHMQ